MDPGVPHQSPPRPEPRPRSLIGLPRVLGIGGSALILVLLMGSTLAASGSGVHAVASAPRPFTGVLSAPQPVTSRLGGPVSPMSGIRAALGPDAPTGVSSTVLLGSGSLYSVLPGNQNPINLLNLESLTTIPGSPDILGTALTGDQGPNGTVFTFNASSNVVDQAVGSPFPNPLASAYVPPTNSVWTADAGYIPNGGTVFTSAVSVLSLSTFNFTHLLQSGNESYAVAYDPDGQQVAVANVELGDVWMYNATQYTLTHIFPTQTAPVAIAYDPSLHDLVVANELADSLSIVNSTTGGSERNVSLMGSPTAVAIGPTGLAYVCLVDQSLVAVINVATGTLVTNLTVGRNCTSLAIDPTSEILYATGFGPTNNVTLFNLTSDHYAPTWKVQSGYKEIAISGAGDYIVMAEDSWNTIWTYQTVGFVFSTSEALVGTEPVAEALDAQDGIVYPVDYYTGMVYAVSHNETVVNNSIGLSLNLGTQYVTWDSRKDTVWATSTQSYHIQVFNGSTQTVTHQILSWTYYPGLVVYDPNEDRVYSANTAQQYVIPTAATSFASDPKLTVVPTPSAMAYDTPNGTLYVGSSTFQASPVTSPIAIVNSSLDKLVRTVQGGGDVTAFAVDSQNQAVYAFCAISDNVTVINGHDNLLSGTIALPPVDPGGFVSSAVYDPVDDLIYLVMGGGMNQVWILDPHTGTVVQQFAVGDNPVSAVYDYAAGAVVVTNAYSGSLSVIRDPARYTVSFQATGLATGVPWLIGAQNTSISSTGATIDYFTQNASAFAWYAYAQNYFVEPSSYGNVTVSGSNVVVSLSFFHVGIAQPVLFTEQGLPFDTSWNVTVNSAVKVLVPVNQTINSKGSTILFSIINGSYVYHVGPVPGFVPSTTTGPITVLAARINITIDWVENNYTVAFSETGLPAGTSWGVTLGTLVSHSTANVIDISAPNGTYHFTVETVSGYNQSAPGTIVINGGNVAKSVSFTAIGLPTQAAGSAGPPLNGAVVSLGLIALAGFMILLALVLEWRYRRTSAELGPSNGPPEPGTDAAPADGEPPAVEGEAPEAPAS